MEARRHGLGVVAYPMAEPATVVFCAAHPNVETGLRCSKCEKPICPRCLVQTPVGARCRECARLRRLPTFDVPPKLFLRAVAGGVGAAFAVGIVWGLLPMAGFFSFVLAAIAGYVIGQVVSRAANRRRNVWLKVLAVACVLLAFVVSELGSPLMRAMPLLSSGAGGIVLLVLVEGLIRSIFLNPMAWLMIALGGFIATTRID